MSFFMGAMSAAVLGYIGPGGGIGLLGPLFGVIAAVVGALLMVAVWPIRYLLKKSRAAGSQATNSAAIEPQQ